MAYRYLTLLGKGFDDNQCHFALQMRAASEALGLKKVASSRGFVLFAAADTPVLHLLHDQVVVGHLFDGTGKLCATPPSRSTGFESTRRRLITEHWGEYLLLQPANDGSGACTLMRDPSGGVPCVYSVSDGHVGFATSDVSLAVALGIFTRTINWDFVARCLMYPNVRTGRTGLVGLEELLPGQTMVMHDTRVRTNEEWSPWKFLSGRHRHSNISEAARDVREVVRRAVRSWAEADRSVLMELSGGLDSSIVATCLGEADVRAICCTVSTPVPGGDERMYSEQVAGALGLPLQSHTLGYGSARFDLPPPASAVVPCMGPLQCAVDEVMEATGTAHGVRSHFTGAGGDTVFGSRSNASPIIDAFKEHGLGASLSTIHDVATLHQCTVWRASRLALRKMSRRTPPHAQPDRSFLRLTNDAYVPAPHPWAAPPGEAFPGDRERAMDLAGTQIFRDDAPRGGKRWVRMPLLSQPVVEACLRVPTWMQVHGGRNRAVARQAFRDMIPADVYHRRSKGTFVAYSGSVYQRQKAQIRSYLCDGWLREAGLLDVQELTQYMDSPAPPRDRLFIRVFELCMIESWVRAQG